MPQYIYAKVGDPRNREHHRNFWQASIPPNVFLMATNLVTSELVWAQCGEPPPISGGKGQPQYIQVPYTDHNKGIGQHIHINNFREGKMVIDRMVKGIHLRYALPTLPPGVTVRFMAKLIKRGCVVCQASEHPNWARRGRNEMTEALPTPATRWSTTPAWPLFIQLFDTRQGPPKTQFPISTAILSRRATSCGDVCYGKPRYLQPLTAQLLLFSSHLSFFRTTCRRFCSRLFTVRHSHLQTQNGDIKIGHAKPLFNVGRPQMGNAHC